MSKHSNTSNEEDSCSNHVLKNIENYLSSNQDTGQFLTNLKNALHVLEEAFITYNSETLCLTFNGGKDCTVLLHLAEAIRLKVQPMSQSLTVLYVKGHDVFPELQQFIEMCTQDYKLSIIEYDGSIKDALISLKNVSNIKAFLIGTRRTDPYSCSLNYFQMTDGDWPEFMRVNPLLDWRYSDIWMFLRKFNLSYCRLYDEGYTSLGDRSKTEKNPLLKYCDEDGNDKYKPAYSLDDETCERLGRS